MQCAVSSEMTFGAKIQTEKENLATWETVNFRTMQLFPQCDVALKKENGKNNRIVKIQLCPIREFKEFS